MPEQEFLPPRPPARSYRPDRDDEDPPPWANLPPVGSTRPRRPVGGSHRAGPGRPAGAVRPGSPSGPGVPLGPNGPGGTGAGPAGPGSSGGHPAVPGGLSGPGGRPGGSADPLQGEPVPQWAEWDEPEADRDEDVPPAQPRESRRSPGPGGRALRAAARRRRRWWFVTAGGLVVVAATVLTVVLVTASQPGPAAVTPGALITTFQAGELRQVPGACNVVPGVTVQRYLPGKTKVASPLPVNGSAESACNWTIDKPPVYRLMELNMLAYAPNGLASGDGSATYAAIDAYDLALQDMQAPPKNSPAPPATVRSLPGLGNQAFSAMQVFRVGGAVTDVATVMVRFHNVVVTVTLNGLDHSNHGSYGPVSQSQLTAAALAFAQAAEASLH